MKKKSISLLIIGSITAQLFIPNTITFADTSKKPTESITKVSTKKKRSVKSNLSYVYTDVAMTQELKNPSQYIYPKEVTLNFYDGSATVDGKQIQSGTKITEPGAHILKITNGNESRTYNFSIINNINGKNIVSISSGGDTTAAVDEDGKLYTWGSNSNGKLGDGTTINKNVPVKVNGNGDIKEDTKIVAVSIGQNHSSAIDNEGNIYMWGLNRSGQLGDQSGKNTSTPTKINGKGAIGTSTKIISIAMGVDSSSALDNEGNLYTWGLNNNGQLGDNSTSNRKIPVLVNGKGAISSLTSITSMSMGNSYMSAVDSEGNLYTWGYNGQGQLGNGSSTTSRVPVKINGQGDIKNNTKIVESSMGVNSSSAIDSKGNLYTWGINSSGQLGDETFTSRNIPRKINGKGDIKTNTKIVSISNGNSSSSAIDNKGNLYTWGLNDNGQLGDGTKINRNTPVKLNGKGSIGKTSKIISVSIFAGGYREGYTDPAIDSEGNLYAWGSNNSGQLGTGNTASAITPVETFLTLDCEKIAKREDTNNLYYDFKVKSSNGISAQLAYKLDDSQYSFVNVSQVGFATITIPKSEKVKKLTVRLGYNNTVVNNVNNSVVIPIESENTAISKLAYFRTYGVVIEGAVSGNEKYDSTVKKYLVIKSKDGAIKLKKDIVSTNWYGDGYSGFQAIVTPENLASIGDIENANVQIEVNYNGKIKVYDLKAEPHTSVGPTPPQNVKPTVKPGTDPCWESGYYYIQDLPKIEFANSIVEFNVNKDQDVLLTNKVKPPVVNLLSCYRVNGEYVIDISVKIPGFDLATNEHTDTFEVKNSNGNVVYTGKLATFASYPGVAPKSALQAIIPSQYSNDSYTYDIVVKDKYGVERARYALPKFFY